MRKQFQMLVLVGLVALMLSNGLQAEDSDRKGAVRGIFIRLIEQKVGDEGYMGIVVKPFDRDDHVTVLIPGNREEIVRSARRLGEGARLGISFVKEDGHNWIRGIEVEMRREKREERPEDGRKVSIRREVRRESDEDRERPESRRSRDPRRDRETAFQRGREEHQDRRPAAQFDQLQRQLREVISGHLDRMSRSVREVLADHLWRMDAEFRELRNRVDRIERELEHLRAENERLRRELRKRSGSEREREREGREHRGNLERNEREIIRDIEEMRENTHDHDL